MSEVFDLDLPVHKRCSTAAHPVEEAKQILELAAVRCLEYSTGPGQSQPLLDWTADKP